MDNNDKKEEEFSTCFCGSGLEEKYCCGEKEDQIGCKCQGQVCFCDGPKKDKIKE
jgi:hypothetical protein